MYCRNKADAFNDTTKIVIICVLTNVHESWPQQNDKKTCKILHKYFYKQTQQTTRSVILQQNRQQQISKKPLIKISLNNT